MEIGCEIARCSPRLEPLVQRHPVTPKPKLGSNGYAQIIAVSVGLIVPSIRTIRVRLAQVIYPLWDCSTTFLASVPTGRIQMSDFREHARNHLRTAAGTYKWAVRNRPDFLLMRNAAVRHLINRAQSMRNWAALCSEVELPIRSQDDCEQGRLEMEYFAGIDVSLRSCALCIVDGTPVRC
jgi:hypothetical protein